MLNFEIENAKRLVTEIETRGYEALLVGGCVRDFVLGVPSKDVDIATNCPMEILERDFNVVADVSKNRDFGIVIIEYNGYRYETAQFRVESRYSDGRRPDEVTFVSTFKQDAGRRDLTFNALGMRANGEIIDYFGGIADINNKVIRVVGCPFDRFGEDFLRLMRVIRFTARFGFEIEHCTAEAVRECSCFLENLAIERVTDELMKMASLGGRKFAHALQLMDNFGMIDVVLPELTILKNFVHSPKHHPEGAIVVRK